MRTEAQKRADKKSKAKNVKQIKYNLNKNTDAGIIEFLANEPNKQGLFKRLIREEMKKRG